MKKLIYLTLFICFTTACSNSKSSKIDYGNWEIKNYVDDFGQSTSEHYYVLYGVGNYANDYINNGNLTAQLMLEKNRITIYLFENNRFYADDHLCSKFQIKDAEGNITIFNTNHNHLGKYGMIFPKKNYGDDMKDYELLKSILEKEGVIHCKLSDKFDYYNHEYIFSFDLKGYNNIIQEFH